MRSRTLFAVLWLVVTLTGISAVGAADAQTVANGPYYAVPSWDMTLPSSTRFIVLANMDSAAVLDRETGLVWERSPETATLNWFTAQSRCNRLAVGDRRGWRLPAIQELASLVDADPANVDSPRLPVGHPFLGIGTSAFWSATIFLDPVTGDPTGLGWHVFFSDGTVGSGSNRGLTNFARAWCVRGGRGADAQ